jgi:hypothetical protein
MYAIVKTSYVGPNKNHDKYIDADRIEICTNDIRADIRADTTDERVAELSSQYEAQANMEGCTLNRADLIRLMNDRRDELIEEIRDFIDTAASETDTQKRAWYLAQAKNLMLHATTLSFMDAPY